MGDQSLSAAQIGKALFIIHLSFERPAIVKTISDREPQTTLFLLHYFDSVTHEEHLKAQIEQEKKFVLFRVANPSKAQMRQ